jgi:hypothetical protein
MCVCVCVYVCMYVCMCVYLPTFESLFLPLPYVDINMPEETKQEVRYTRNRVYEPDEVLTKLARLRALVEIRYQLSYLQSIGCDVTNQTMFRNTIDSEINHLTAGDMTCRITPYEDQ